MASQTRFSQRARIALTSILIGVILMLPSGIVGAAPTPPARGEETLFGRPTPLADLLNPDGTLNVPAGFEGSLDPAGWRLVSGPEEAPRFGPAAPLAASDVNWDDGFYPRGTSHAVYALVWGGGNLYAGGLFTAAGAAAANYIARWDGANWSALGLGMNSYVHALVWDGSNLYAGGNFATAGGVTANYIAKWDGANWSALGTGMNNYVEALAWDGSNLYAGGDFTTAGGVAVNHVAKWDGANWSALGTGMNYLVEVLEWDGSNLYAGGQFTTAGGAAANYVAKWDGANWSALGTGMNNTVKALLWAGGNLYVGGNFTTAGGVGAFGVARWNGANWSALGMGASGTWSLAWDGSNLYAGGAFSTIGGMTVNRIARWDGASWSALGTGMNDSVYTLAWDGGNSSAGLRQAQPGSSGQALYAGGLFGAAGGAAVHHIAKWDGANWSAFLNAGEGLHDRVSDLVWGGDNLYAGGSFTAAGGVAADYIARWNGANWSALGTGMNNPVYALAWDGSNLYAGGYFTTAGGVTVNRIAKWDGTNWSALGTGVNGSVYALAWGGSNLYAGGDFTTAGGVAANRIAKWDGANWSALGTGMNQSVFALVWGEDNPSAGLRQAQPGSSGQALYAGGRFTTAGGVTVNYIARWDGTNWSALGSGMNLIVETLAWDGRNPSAGSGQALYAGGWFTMAGGTAANRIAKWDGANWSALGTGMNWGVYALAWDGSNPSAGLRQAQPGSSGQALYAAGDFATAGGVAAKRIARWDGCNWSALGSGTDNAVWSLAWYSGYTLYNLYAGGDFGTAGGKASSHIARWRGAALWDGGGGDNNWSTAANWSGDIPPEASNTVVLAEFSGKDAVLDAAFTGQVGGVVVKPAYAGTVTMNRALQVSGNLVLQGGAFIQGSHDLTVSCCFSQAEGTFTGGAGTLTIGNAFDLTGGTFTAPSGNMNVAGNFINSGTFSHNNGTVTFNGATAISGSSTHSFNNVTISGNLTAPGGNMNVAGNFTRNGGAFSHNSGTVTFNGSGTQNLALDAATTFYNLTVNSGVTLVETVAADNATVSGTLINSGVIRKTQAISGTGSQTFGLTGVQMNVTAQGTLSSVQVDRRDSHHPNATTGLQTGRYWTLTPTGSDYTVNLTLPTAFTPDAQDKVCRYTGSGQVWDCAMSAYTGSSITRDGVTAFSDWAAGNDVGPTAITLRGLTARSGRLVGGWLLLVGSAAAAVWLGRRRILLRRR